MDSSRVGYSQGNWDSGSHKILWPQAKHLAWVTPFSWWIHAKEMKCSVVQKDFVSKGKEIVTCQMYCLRMNFCQNKLFLLQGNAFLSNKCCQRKWFSVKGHNFLSIEIISCLIKWYPGKGNYFLSKEMISCKQKLFPVKENDFL